MRLGYVNYWFVEVFGDYDQFGLINDFVFIFLSLFFSIQKGENGDGFLNSDFNKMYIKIFFVNILYRLNSLVDFYVIMVF